MNIANDNIRNRVNVNPKGNTPLTKLLPKQVMLKVLCKQYGTTVILAVIILRTRKCIRILRNFFLSGNVMLIDMTLHMMMMKVKKLYSTTQKYKHKKPFLFF